MDGWAVLVGLLFGIQHATDADHVVAVATIVSRTRRFGAGAVLGLFWGLGHTVTIATVGAGILLLNLRVTPSLGRAMEAAVAAMLMALGAWRLVGALRGSDPVPVEHLTAPHAHPHARVFHSHPHVHGDIVHRHPHVHPHARLLRALRGVGAGQALSSALVGVVHGLAGSAALALLVLSTIRTPGGALLYLLLFGLGTIIGMTAITALLAVPFTLPAPWLSRWRRVFAIGTGALSLAFGGFLAIRIGHG
jgi:high-affinity nickel-transport protein